MTDVLVTVVIATRDRPELLREALAAVREQALDGVVETIVVHDQSEPDLSIASEDPRRPVRVISNARQVGLAGARNTGILAAAGELLAFCDDDDVWLPGKLAAQVEAVQDPAVSMASCGIYVEYDGERHERVLDAAVVSFDDLLRDRHTELHPSTFLFRTAVLRERIGLVSEQVPGAFGEDYELLLRAARTGPVAVVRRPLVVVRWHGTSFFFRRWDTMAAGLGWILDEYPEFASEPHGYARVRGQIAFANASAGRRRQAWADARAVWRRRLLEPRAALAVLVCVRLVTPAFVMRSLHRFGRGI
ncbi:glycosyltransferase family 2 protein [Cellulomonas sp. DKR-3]|uniref:Glycosyltransferase family 2 protein n=1 Tax=Cellulomonas fulva TaxID=2835530 RepID=A0ABS5TUR8_9CELL|nr:glycosyltransferase family 2 protein [Cellulomonas fulva]MBT0992897.1 glycosyltransferase family 2 protein [Cellulomonas fulva]